MTDVPEGLRLFVVIPDAYDGGSEWQQVIRALTPRDACMVLRTYMHAQEEISEFEVVTDGVAVPGQEVWVTREFPPDVRIDKTYGVVDWRKFKLTMLTPLRKQAKALEDEAIHVMAEYEKQAS